MAVEAKKSSNGRDHRSDDRDVAISVRDLWKVFGKDPQQALAEENTGLSKRDLQENFGLIVGLQEATFDVYR